MLDPKLVPSRLFKTSERPPVVIVESTPPRGIWGFHLLGIMLGWAGHVLRLWLRRRLTRAEYARSFRELLENLGGLWIKAGQLLSLRVDIFSREFCQELSKLQEQARGFPAGIARSIIEEELGAPLEGFFDYFEDAPFAAASIGQIHRAHLRQEGVWVAVKVQRPEIARSYGRDLNLIQWIVRLLNLFRSFSFLRFHEALLELRNIMNEELDYRYEATAMRRMKKTLRKHNIYVPKVFSKYTTQRLLVTEFIHAVLMGDFIKMYASDPVRLSGWLRENNVDPRVVSRRLVFSIFRQLFEDNLFHGDLHPGNILLLRDSRVALIDLGTIGFTEAEFLQKMRLFTQALVTQDFSKAADISLLLCTNLPAVDLESMKLKLVRFFRTWAHRTMVRELPYQEKSLDRAFIEVSKIMTVEYKIWVDWAFLRIRRALTTLDSALIYLYPDANYTKIMGQYFRSAERRAIQRATGRRLLPQAIKGALMALEFQQNFFESFFFQSATIRRQAQVFQGTTSKFANLFSVLCGQVAGIQTAVGVIFLLVFLHQHHSGMASLFMGRQLTALVQVFPQLDYQVWLVILFLCAYLSAVSLKLRKRFAEKEVRLPERIP